MTAALAV